MVERPGMNSRLLVNNSTFVLDTVGTGDPLFYDLSKYLIEHGAKKVILFRHPFEETKRLGVHPGTVHRYVSNGSLPHVRTPSNKIRIKQSDLSRLDEFYGGKFE